MKLFAPELIQTARLSLTKPQLQTAAAMFSAVDHDRARLSEFLPWVPGTKSIGDEVNYLRWARAEWDKSDLFDYTVFLKSDQTYIGNMGFHSIAWHHRRAEIGYWIASTFENQGYVTEAVHKLTCTGFDMGFHRIEIRCSTANARSKNVPERLGYKLEATLEDDTILNEKFRSTLIYAALATNYVRSPIGTAILKSKG